MVSSIERFHCIQDSQLGLNDALYREVPLFMLFFSLKQIKYPKSTTWIFFLPTSPPLLLLPTLPLLDSSSSSLRIPTVQTLHPLDAFYKAKQSVKVFMKMSASMTSETQATVS